MGKASRISWSQRFSFWPKRPVAEAIDVPTLYGTPKKRA
jgi:hypothetical protein